MRSRVQRSYLYGDQAEDLLGGGIGGEGGGEKKVGETNGVRNGCCQCGRGDEFGRETVQGLVR